MKNLIYVASYPKSGATWFRFLIYTLFHQQLSNSRQVVDFYPEIKINGKEIQEKLSQDKDFFLKSHFSYSEDLDYLDNIKHVIYIIRDPFNCMKSRLDFYRYDRVKWIDSKVRRLHYLENFFEEANFTPEKTNDKMHGGWNHHVVSWLKEKKPFPITLIKYEDLIHSDFKVLSELNENLQLNFKPDEIRKACTLSSFDNIKKLEDFEMANKIVGMFYGPQKPNAYSKKENIRFVMKGKKRNFYADLSLPQKIQGIQAFEEGLFLGNYKDILAKLNYLQQLKKELSSKNKL